jgi:hypothetical protein
MADDPIPDWRLLAPHRPLSPGDDAYVARPESGGDAIASWVEAGGSTVLVSGPTGVGKSTELAHAESALRSTRVACLLQIDRFANMHKLTADLLMHFVAVGLIGVSRQLRLPVSKEIASAADALTQGQDPRKSSALFRTGGANAARLAAEEIVRVSQQGRAALLIDGLEKILPGPDTREIFDALSQLPEPVDLVVVIPWHAAFGGGTEPILRAGERLYRVAALDTEGVAGAAAKQFLARVLARRLQGNNTLPEPLEPLLDRAFKASGGIPRIFLQLMADAGTYARVRRGAAWPDDSDLHAAIVDQEDSFRRALLPGDSRAMQDVAGTDGRELDLERRVRLGFCSNAFAAVECRLRFIPWCSKRSGVRHDESDPGTDLGDRARSRRSRHRLVSGSRTS